MAFEKLVRNDALRECFSMQKSENCRNLAYLIEKIREKLHFCPFPPIISSKSRT